MKSNDPRGTVLDEKYHEDARNVGFYNSVKRGSQNIHIETEVNIGNKIEITTKIWSGGSVDEKIVQIFEQPEEDIVPQLRAAAELQHNEAHEKAKRRGDAPDCRQKPL